MPSILGDGPRGFASVETSPGVAFTNLLVAMLATVLILAGATLFNEALEENSGRLDGPLAGLAKTAAKPIAPLAALWAGAMAAWAALVPGKTVLDRLAGPLILLFVTGLIYSFLEPNFGLDQRGFVIFVSLVVSQGVLALVYEGGKVWLYKASYHRTAALKVFPACILIALVSVGLSRLGNFQPGVIIGFVAAAKLLEPTRIPRDDHGKALATMAAILLGVAVVAWLVAAPLHTLYDDNPTLATALPAAIAITIFIVVIEGLLFSLLPLRFIDGSHIWKWNRLVWLALFIPAGLFFAQALFNQEEQYLDLVLSHRSLAGLAMLGGYLVVTVGTWVYFTRRSGEEAAPESPGVGPEAAEQDAT